ncbi:omptin family outer membrane protease [Sinorhizobium medicae]|nr:omptin family outer membrane protease [Sinorhizobium medicae]
MNLDIKGEFGIAWTVSGNVDLGFSGNSHMEDYDWASGDYAFDNWTDQSIHPGADLDRYINLDAAIGKNFAMDENITINLHGRFKYTNVKWTAHGGSYIYSKLGFRDDFGKFTAGEKGITSSNVIPASSSAVKLG